MHKTTIDKIEKALRAHTNYKGKKSFCCGSYLNIMDRLAYSYPGTLSEKVSNLLDDYFKKVNVSNLSEAFERLEKMDDRIN